MNYEKELPLVQVKGFLKL